MRIEIGERNDERRQRLHATLTFLVGDPTGDPPVKGLRFAITYKSPQFKTPHFFHEDKCAGWRLTRRPTEAFIA